MSALSKTVKYIQLQIRALFLKFLYWFGLPPTFRKIIPTVPWKSTFKQAENVRQWHRSYYNITAPPSPHWSSIPTLLCWKVSGYNHPLWKLQSTDSGFFVCFSWITVSGAQDLSMALHAGITSGRQETKCCGWNSGLLSARQVHCLL